MTSKWLLLIVAAAMVGGGCVTNRWVAVYPVGSPSAVHMGRRAYVATQSTGLQSFDVRVIALDTRGKPLYSSSFGGPSNDFASAILGTDDGGSLVVGTTASFPAPSSGALWAVKLGTDGTPSWSRSYRARDCPLPPCRAAQGVAVEPSGSNSFVVLGQASFGSDTDFWLLRINQNGGVLWQRAYGDNGDELAHAMTRTRFGHFVLAGKDKRPDGESSDVWVLEVVAGDAGGKVLWQKRLVGLETDGRVAVAESSSGGFFVVANALVGGSALLDPWLIKLDALGEIEWQKRYSSPGLQHAFSIEATKDGGAVVGGTEGRGQSSRSFLFKVDGTGSLVWQRRYTSGSRFFATDFDARPNGQQIMTGSGSVSGSWVALTSQDGSLGPDCDVAQELELVAVDTGAIAEMTNKPVKTPRISALGTPLQSSLKNLDVEYVCFDSKRM